jgi:hypothetical protein
MGNIAGRGYAWRLCNLSSSGGDLAAYVPLQLALTRRLAVWVGCWVWQSTATLTWLKRGAFSLPHARLAE